MSKYYFYYSDFDKSELNNDNEKKLDGIYVISYQIGELLVIINSNNI